MCSLTNQQDYSNNCYQYSYHLSLVQVKEKGRALPDKTQAKAPQRVAAQVNEKQRALRLEPVL